MSYDDDIKTLDQFIDDATNSLAEQDATEKALLAEIEEARVRLAKLRDGRYKLKQQVRKASTDRESFVRKSELEKEAALIQARLDATKQLVDSRLADAPWLKDAFDWQIEGAKLLPERALLGDKRGMGKTFSAIIWMRIHDAKKTLICLRNDVAFDFIKELRIREPDLFVYDLTGATDEQRHYASFLLSGQKRFIVVTNIESWRRNTDKKVEDLLRIDYDAMILDEAHNIKNFKSVTAQGFMLLAQRIPKVLEMTGTPIKNKPQEMFSLLHALYPDLFPTEKAYLRDYCVQLSQNKWAFTADGLMNLVRKISSFYLARTPEDVGRKIPPPRVIEYKLKFDNHEAQKAAYQMMTERALAVLNSGKVIPIVSQLAIMTRQAQTVSWPAGISFTDPETFERVSFDVHESVKMDWAEDLITQLHDEGERVVFFSRFKPAIVELKERLRNAGLSVAVITGDEKGDIEEIFNDFDLKTAPENPKYDVLLATYQTVGESANFNSAAHVMLYDRFWNPGNEDQATGRVDRINSVRQATVHIPIVENSIDEYMTELINDKRNLVTDFGDTAQQQSRLLTHLRGTKES